jgi:lipopolysaccharide transport system permease protein
VVSPLFHVGGRLGTLLALNPMTHVVDAFRDVLIAGQAPGAAFWMTAAMSIVLLGAAWVAFHRAEFTFAENL